MAYDTDPLSEEEIKELEEGLKDIEEGRTIKAEEVWKELGIE